MPAVPSGRRESEELEPLSKENISFSTMSVTSPTDRVNRAVSSRRAGRISR